MVVSYSGVIPFEVGVPEFSESLYAIVVDPPPFDLVKARLGDDYEYYSPFYKESSKQNLNYDAENKILGDASMIFGYSLKFSPE
jgi:hypothetical protein